MENWDGEGWRCPLCGRLFRDRVGLVIHLAEAPDERHAQLWAILGSKAGREHNIRRKQLLEKLAVRA